MIKFLLLVIPFFVVSQTNVSGVISDDITWTLANSPYIVTGNVLVKSGVTLTIEAGVVVKFNSGFYLKVQGSLIAIGTESNKITFTTNESSPARGDWDKIWLASTSTLLDSNDNYVSGTIFNHCIISYADEGLRLDDSSFYLANSELSNNNTGINFKSVINSVITNNDFKNNGSGTSTSAGTEDNEVGSFTYTKFLNNIFQSNTSHGLVFGGYRNNANNNLIKNNISKNNGGDGFSFEWGDVVTGFADNTIEGNIIYNNAGNGIVVGRDSNVIKKNLIINNSGRGLSISGTYIYQGLTIENNIFSGNSGYALDLSSNTNSTIKYNSLLNGSTSSPTLAIPSSYITSSNNTITYNTIFNSPSNTIEIRYGPNTFNHNNFIKNHGDFTFKLLTGNNSAINAENNYWGTTNESEIKTAIYDYSDDFELGTVDYTPFLTALNTAAPISPPSNVTKSASGNDVVLNWSANEESDLAGYKLYYGDPTGYSYSNVVDLGNVTTYTVTDGDIATEYAITAYDTSIDGIDDMVDGNESWYSLAASYDSNSAPVASNQSLGISKNTTSTINLSATDSDASDTSFVFSIVTLPSNGVLKDDGTVITSAGDISGVLTYTPYNNYIGNDSFKFTAKDDESATSNVATVSITVNDISGVIDSNATWTLANSPYIVTGNVLVKSGVTLTIEAGVVVKFNSGFYLKVQGSLIAIGTESNKITFTTNESSPARGDWDKIWLASTSTLLDSNDNYVSGTIFNHCIISYADEGLRLDDSSFYLANSELSNNNTGINFKSVINSVITNNDFKNNGSGTSTSAGTEDNEVGSFTYTKFLNNIFQSNTSHGLVFGGYRNNANNNLIKNNISKNNGGDGFSFEWGDVVTGFADNTIEGNIIYNNAGNGIVVGRDSNVIKKNLIINNSGRGLSISGTYIYQGLTIENNIFSGNSGYALDLSSNTNSTIKYNSLLNGSTSSPTLAIPSSYITSSNNTITYNTIFNSPSNTIEIRYGPNTFNHNNFIKNHGDFTFKLLTGNNSAINAENNYWGTTNESEIKTAIYDYSDDFELGTVDYTPFLTALNTAAPISPPSNVTKSASGNDVVLNWSANEESDLAGYKLYYGDPTGYSYSNVVDLGNVTTYTVTDGDIATEYAITAYDTSIDGIDDMVDGNESWYSKVNGDSSLSINDLDFANSISITPNPASNMINIIINSNTIYLKSEVYNMVGQLILESNEKNISIEKLTKSIYFLNILTEEGFVTKKFIKN